MALSVFCTAIRSEAQDVSLLPLDNKQSILNERVFLTFPSGARNVARPVDIMAPDPNINEETRIMMDTGDMRLVFFAQEIYTVAGDDMLAKIQAANAPHQVATKKIMDKDGLIAVLSSPERPDSSDQTLIGRLLVRTSDHTLLQVSAYINASAYPQLKSFRKLTERIYATLAAGTRKVSLTPHKDTIPLIDMDRQMIADLPQDYSYSVDQQYDFQVIRFHHYSPLGEAGWSDMFIYIGDHPHSVYLDFNMNEKDGHKVDGTFLGKKIQWLQFDITTEKMIDRELKIHPDGDQGLIFHVAMMSSDLPTLEKQTQIMEHIRLGKVK